MIPYTLPFILHTCLRTEAYTPKKPTHAPMQIHVNHLHTEVMLHIFSYLLYPSLSPSDTPSPSRSPSTDVREYACVCMCVCRLWYNIHMQKELYFDQPLVDVHTGEISPSAFQYLGLKSFGTGMWVCGMFVCAYGCVRVWMCMYLCVPVYGCIFVYLCMCMCVSGHMYVCFLCMCAYACMCVCVRVCIWMCVCMYECVYICVHSMCMCVYVSMKIYLCGKLLQIPEVCAHMCVTFYTCHEAWIWYDELTWIHTHIY